MPQLEDRIYSIKRADSRILAMEAVRAYGAGAYRAAIASIWVAVVTDLRQKIEDLSGSDAEAKAWIEEYAKAKSEMEALSPNYGRMQKLEDAIIDFSFTRLELLTARESTELSRLRHDRNLCVHPNSLGSGDLFTPTPELARLHIVTAIDAVLSQGIKAGRSLLSLLEKEISSESWPNASEDMDYFIDRYFHSARSGTRGSLASVLIKNSFKTTDLTNRIVARSQRAAKAIALAEPEVFEQRLKMELGKAESSGIGDEELQRCVGSFGFSGCFLDALPKSALTRLKSLIPRAAIDDLIKNRFFAGGTPAAPDLKDLFMARLDDLSHEQIAIVCRQTPDREFLVSPAIRLVSSSENFAEARERMSTLAALGANMNAKHVEQLMEAVKNNPGDQIRPARGVDELLLEMFTDSDNRDRELLDKWHTLAETLRDLSTGDSAFYGRGDRYSDLLDSVATAADKIE